ncbi:hypothetical protein M758_9G027100 [Ceratodon purpureus]|nr:hypothetical protein M758_9G027100 [Ceratodon purpureus]
MLDMSVMKYEEQNEDSKEKLREALRARFEFLDHEMTDLHLDRIIKTWVRRNRERMKRVHGGKLKAPRKYVDTQWDALRQYWDTPASRQKSERMSETRKKVTSNPRVGRQGYAGKKAKLRSEREVTPDVTDVAKELKTAMVNPDTAEMEKKNSQRLSAMEKRLEDVLQSNLNLQTMLQSVLKTVSPDINVKELRQSAQSGGDGVHEPSTNEEKRACPDPGNSTGLVNTEGWWDKVCKLTDEENELQEGDQQRVDTMRKSKDQVISIVVVYYVVLDSMLVAYKGASDVISVTVSPYIIFNRPEYSPIFDRMYVLFVKNLHSSLV